ncbi:hypothetical protein MPSI1_002202 [Malassezia psittaci]|uniref:Bola-like protein n=1 Tax=Malassezia psittaci TaxID=1821823 RepID=A0AAF0F6X8_9BASI|nr:hypothetical protein MPSI1_002202 [Malassezia psittaci]
MVSQAELEAAIHEKVGQIATLFVADVSGGCGQAYDVVLVSDQFEGMPTLKRHRLVNERLKQEIAAMHAFSQKTYTTKQFAELRSKYSQVPSNGVASASSKDSTSAPSVGENATNSQSSSNSDDRFSSGDVNGARSVAVPELTLTPDDTSSRIGTAGAAAIERGSSPVQMDGPPRRPNSVPGISRLHYRRISDVEFWLALRSSLEEQFLNPDDMDLDLPGTMSPNQSRRPPGEAEVERLFEDFFLTQKHHLSANDIARIRDATGMLGMAGA